MRSPSLFEGLAETWDIEFVRIIEFALVVEPALIVEFARITELALRVRAGRDSRSATRE